MVYAQQNPAVIDQGVFHNDVIAVGNGNVLFYHEQAFADEAGTLRRLRGLRRELLDPRIEAARGRVVKSTGDGLIALAATFVSYGLTEIIHSYGFLSVFVAALAFRRVEARHEIHSDLHGLLGRGEQSLMFVDTVHYRPLDIPRSIVEGFLPYWPKTSPHAVGTAETAAIARA